MRVTMLACIGVALILSGCVSVPREAATTLAKAGQTATAASRQSLEGVADDVGATTERQLVRSALVGCESLLASIPAPSATTPCLPAVYSAEAAAAELQNQRLTAIIVLRTRAIGQLNAAYAAFEAEAEYGARADLTGALQELTGTVTTLTAATVVLTGGSAAPLLILTPIAQRLAAETAEMAQRRRLMAASIVLREIDRRLIEALTAEAGVYAVIAGGIASHRASVTDSFLSSGFTSPLPTLSDFLTRNGLALASDIKPNDRRAVAVARTIQTYRARRSAAAFAEAYEANINALKALVEQHERFEADKELSLEQLTFAISELTAWVEMWGSLSKSEETTAQ